MDRVIKQIFILILILFSGLSAKDNILIFYPDAKEFNNAINWTIENEIGEEFNISKHIISKKSTPNSFNNTIKHIMHKVIILYGNRSINYYKKYLKLNPNDSTPIIQLMALKIRENGIPLTYNTTGISYEIPFVTTLTKFRTISKTSINNIGIIYRKHDKKYITENIKYCINENFKIKAIMLKENESSFYYKKNIKKALNILINYKNVKTIIIPNDNKLLTTELIKTVWKPITNRSKCIVITGVNTLVSPEINFATYATIPNSNSLGFQTSELIYELKENNWKFRSKRIEPPLAISDILDYNNAKNRIKLNHNEISNIETILK